VWQFVAFYILSAGMACGPGNTNESANLHQGSTCSQRFIFGGRIYYVKNNFYKNIALDISDRNRVS